MLQKIKAIILTILMLATFGSATTALALAVAAPVAAQPIVADFKGDACGGVSEVGGNCGNGASGASHLMKVALDLLTLAAGFIAVVMVIVSGIKFMTAAGDASQISSARQSLIYALVGVVVAAFAQIIVVFVIGKATK